MKARQPASRVGQVGETVLILCAYGGIPCACRQKLDMEKFHPLAKTEIRHMSKMCHVLIV